MYSKQNIIQNFQELTFGVKLHSQSDLADIHRTMLSTQIRKKTFFFK